MADANIKQLSHAGGAILFLVAITAPTEAHAGPDTMPLLHLCCDAVAHPDGACTAQDTSCVSSGGVAIDLENLPASAQNNDWVLPPALFGATFPSGTDAYMTWTSSPPLPWLGYCLLPSTNTTKPVGCLSVSLSPGVGASMVDVQVPQSPAWTAWEACYGAPPCAGVNDIVDPTVTDVGGACCGPPQQLRTLDSKGLWHIVMGQEIPGVPPPVVILGSDGQPYPDCAHYEPSNLPYYEWDAGLYVRQVGQDAGALVVTCSPDAGFDQFRLPQVCEAAFNESANCGAKPESSGFESDAGVESPFEVDLADAACVPQTCYDLNGVCGNHVSDGCGGLLDCSGNCKALAAGDCSATAPGNPSSGAGAAAGGAALVAVVAFGLTRRRRR